MRCKIVEPTYMTQYYEVNQKSKKRRFYIITSRKPVWCTGKLLKIKSKLIWIPFTFFVEYVFFFFFFFFFVVQNVVGKIDKETLWIGFRIDSTFGLKK